MWSWLFWVHPKPNSLLSKISSFIGHGYSGYFYEEYAAQTHLCPHHVSFSLHFT